MSAIRVPVRHLPPRWTLEVWGDSMAWIVSPDGQQRVLLREFLERDGWTRLQMDMGNVTEVEQPAGHDEVHCSWRKQWGRGWRCEHGVVSMDHPTGYCDQACCR